MAKRARTRTATMVQRSRRMSSQDKALVHQSTGRVRRPFLGLTPEDVATITRRLDDGIRAKTRAT